MLIMFHGTGDDDSKSENFIPAIAKLLRERYNEIVLVMPGVSSAQRSQIGTRATECLELLEARSRIEQWQPLQHNHSPSSNPDGLTRAIQQAKTSAFQYSTKPIHEVPDYVIPGGEAAEIHRLVQSQRGEGWSIGFAKLSANKKAEGIKAVGVKTRMSVAALCAVRYLRLGGTRPLRIIGHSRGGSAAVGAHNLVAFHGFEVVQTLTLDPCHGFLTLGPANAAKRTVALGAQTLGNGVKAASRVASSLFGGASQPANTGGQLATSDIHMAKDYYSKVWNGQLVNIPCVKGVNKDTLGRYVVMRPVIDAAGTAQCENLPKLKTIRHGHMGKFLPYPDDKVKKATRIGNLPGGGGNVAIKDGAIARLYGLNARPVTPPKPEKKVWQQRIQGRIDAYIDTLAVGIPLDEALRGLFNVVDPQILGKEGDIKVIAERVIQNLCVRGVGDEMLVSQEKPHMHPRNADLHSGFRPSSLNDSLLEDEGDLAEGFSDDEDEQSSTSMRPFRLS